MSDAPLSLDEAIEAFVESRRRGDPVDVATFAARHPRLGDELVHALEAYESLDLALNRRTIVPLGDFLGPYRVVREIGRGGMGVVLEAVEEPLGRRVALKVLPAELVSSPTARARLRREAQIAARLDHSGIATIYGADMDAAAPWIAMRYVEGETLAALVARAGVNGARCVAPVGADANGADAPRWIAATMARVARALQFAHEQGVLHRDVKPSNVIVAPDGSPVLLDFGLAIGDANDGSTLTRTGQTAGTPAYLAPELVSGDANRHDVASDVYALGVTTYECLTLRRPYEGPTPAALYRAISSGAHSAVRSLNRDVPRDLAVVVATAMERDPARRYASAAALADDLEACAAGRPIRARAVPLHGRISRWAAREPRLASLAALLALCVVGLAVLGGSWWSSRATVLAAERADRVRRHESLLQAGFASLATRRPIDADASFLAALELESNGVEARIGRVLVRLDQGRDAEAALLARDLPSSPAVDALREDLSGRISPLDLGSAWFARASSIELFVDGMRLSQRARRGSRLEREAVFRLAAARLSEATNRAREARASYHMLRASACREARDEAGVRSSAAALATLWPDSPRALSTAANALQRIDPDAALPLLARAIELDPTWGSPHGIRANIHAFARRYEDAIEEARLALRLDPTDAGTWNTLGLACLKLGCRDDARAAFRTALTLQPALLEAWTNLGDLAAAEKDVAERERCLRAALVVEPGDAFAHQRLALVLHDRKETPLALDHVVAGLAFDPASAWSWQVLAVLAWEEGRAADALWAADRAVELEPTNTEYARLQGILRRRLDEAGRAHSGLTPR